MNHRSDFDLDLKFGELGEELVRRILTGDVTVEVKTDRMVHLTGNFAIEFESRGRPSGLSVTKADYWALVCADTGTITLVKTDELRKLCSVQSVRIVLGGDNNSSRLYLLPRSSIR